MNTAPALMVFVRHGEAALNKMAKDSKKGDDSAFTEEVRQRHSWTSPLTKRGVEQAVTTGRWIQDNLGDTFDAYHVSPTVRTMQTAAKMQLPSAHWRTPDFRLLERLYGLIDIMPNSERDARYPEHISLKKREPFYFSPPDGETLVQLLTRVYHFLSLLHRQWSGKRVLVVTHGEWMWALRVLIEKIPPWDYKMLDRSRHPHDAIHNCQVLAYSRINPETEELGDIVNWLFSACPWQTDLSPNAWQRIKRKSYSNETLGKLAAKLAESEGWELD